MDYNVCEIKSFDFAVRIVKLYKYLTEQKKEYVMSKQLLRSGTSIGANIAEAQRGFSKADFSYKMGISLKEANESEYWIRLLHRTGYIDDNQFESLNEDISEILKILTAICKTTNNENQ